MTEVLRKSAQEVEIDHLLAEEFACDSGFVARFLSAGGIALDGFRVVATIAEPSLGGDGFGDLLIEGTIQAGSRAALLIEDKITAGPAVRQAERYAAFARVLRESGFGTVLTVLVAPASYRGERDHFDAFISLETVTMLINSPDPLRLSYRRHIIERALSKKRVWVSASRTQRCVTCGTITFDLRPDGVPAKGSNSLFRIFEMHTTKEIAGWTASHIRICQPK